MKKDINRLRKSVAITIIVAIVIMICPVTINYIVSRWCGGYFTPVTSGDIVSFCGSIIGGAIGGVAALIAIYYTLKYNVAKDKMIQAEGVYSRQLERIERIIRMINDREIVPYDSINSTRLPQCIMEQISKYNGLVTGLRGYYTECGVHILSLFQEEYDRKHNINHVIDTETEMGRISVIEFLKLDREIRDCAETIGKYALYENAAELLMGDPRISYILEIEAGGSAGLWAHGMHIESYIKDDYHYEMLQKLFPLVNSLLSNLESYKETEYKRIVLREDQDITPAYTIKREKVDGSFMNADKSVITPTNHIINELSRASCNQ